MKILGLDYGESKVGAALGDSESKVATPFKIIKNRGWQLLIEEIKKICREENIEKIIVGLPVNHQAKSPDQAKKTEDFMAKLRQASGLEVVPQNEEFTTLQAKKISGQKQEDAVAAMLILQAYLDGLK